MKTILYSFASLKTAVLLASLCWSGVLQAPLLGQEVPTPGPEHQRLKKLEGTWTAKVKMGGEESAGTMVSKAECGGLWVSSLFQGEFGGQKFEGRGLDGYDPKKGKYVSVWVDSMSTQPFLLEGTYDEKKKTLTMFGDAPGPDGKPIKHKMVTQITDDDHHKFTGYMLMPDGQEQEVIAIEYTRKK